MWSVRCTRPMTSRSPRIHHWYWARAQAGGYCVIASDITAERKYGHTQVPIFMLAKDGKILADDSSLVRFEKTGEHPDPVTGKPVADTTVYDYDATASGGERHRVTFRRENTIVQARMIESVKGPKRVLAQLAGFDSAYMRFTGQVTVERTGSDPVPETVTAPAATSITEARACLVALVNALEQT